MTTQTDRYRFEIVIDSDQIAGSVETMTKAAAAAKRLETSFRDVQGTVDGLNLIRESLSRLFTELEGKAAQVSETSRALQRLARVASTAQATIDKAAAKVRDSADAHRKLETASRRTESAIDDVGDEAQSAGRQIESAARDAAGMRSSLRNIASTAAGTAAGLVSVELATRAAQAAFELLRSGVESYAENTVEGAQAQEELTTALDITRTAIGRGVVESQAWSRALEAANFAAANADEITRQLTLALDAALIVVDGLAVSFGAVSTNTDSAGRSMTDAENRARSFASVITQISTIAIDAAIGIERFQTTVRQIPDTAGYVLTFGPVGALTGLGESLTRSIEERTSQSENRIRELLNLRDELTAGAAASFTRTEDETAAALERSTEAFNDAREAAENYRNAQSGPRGGGRGRTAAESFDFAPDAVIQEEIARTTALLDEIRAIGLQAAEDRQRDRQDQIDRRKFEIGQEIELERARAEELAAIQLEAADRAADAAQAQAERMRDIYTQVASSVTEPLAEIYGAGIDRLLDGEAEKVGVAARRIIGNQLVTIGKSAITASGLVAVADPAAAFVPNPVRSGAMLAAGGAAIAAGKALGATSGGGGGGRPPAREVVRQTPQQQLASNTTINVSGLITDPRSVAREIDRVTSVSRRQGAIR